jgi:hypothetical protein
MGPRYGKCESVKVVQATREIRDLITGSTVVISNPDAYELETVLIDSAFYKYRDKEFRFLLCHARESGLKIA